MKSQNHVQLIGYLGSDPIVSKKETAATRARMRMATQKYSKDDRGATQCATTWHTIIVLGKLAETVANNYIKGSHVLVQGEIIYRTYTDAANIEQSVTEIKAHQLMNLDR